MDGSWWQLPGPSGFVRGVISDLRSGNNVVLTLPGHAPAGLRDSLVARVRENDMWRWRAAEAADFPAQDPSALVDALGHRFAPGDDGRNSSTAADLAGRLSGTILWIENMNNATWPVWSQFLTQFQHACAGRAKYDRGLFCVPVTTAVSPPPVPESALCIQRWGGVVDRLDMTLYLDRAFDHRFDHPLHHRLAVAVAAELAGTDAELARRLAEQDLSTLTDPVEFLTDFASQRGWVGDAGRLPNWQDGSSDLIDGVCTPHSAAVAALGQRSEILRRVWRGQVGVLFPVIEEIRLQIAPQVGAFLRFPIETTYGSVQCVEDLEVGQLVHFLRGKKVPPRVWQLLNLLRDMRHSLAHLRPVSPSTLCAEELLSRE